VNLKSEIIRRVESLPVELQQQFLSYVEGLEQPCPRGESGDALLASFAGVLDDASAAEMTKAIESACEGVDPREW
jgi:hypothetical protein